MQKEACWTLSNITASTSNHIQAVIDANIMPVVIDLLLSDTVDKKVKEEAQWVVNNLKEGGTPEQVEKVAAMKEEAKRKQ